MPSVKCPIHGKQLKISETSLDACGMVLPCVVGDCPDCKCRYVNRAVFPSCNTFKIGNQEYVFSDALNHAYPPKSENTIPDTVESKPSSSTKKKSSPQKLPTQPKEKTSAKKKNSKTSKSKACKSCDPRPIDPRKIYPSSEHLISYFTPSSVSFGKTMPKNCTKDRSPLKPSRHIEIAMDGAIVRTVGSVCPQCGTAYLTNAKREQLEEKIKRRREIEKVVGSAKPPAVPKYISESICGLIPDALEDSCAVFAHQVYFMGQIPANCIQDNQKIISQKHIILDIDGAIIETQGRYCPKCKSAYFLRYRQYEFQDEIQKRNGTKKKIAQKETTSNDSLILSQIPIIDSKQQKCTFCRRPIKGNTVMKCRLKDITGEEVVLPLAMRKCDQCGSIYLKQAVLLELQHFNLTPILINPAKYSSPAEMLKEITFTEQPMSPAVETVCPNSTDNSGSKLTVIKELPEPVISEESASSAQDTAISEEPVTFELEQIPILNSNRNVCPYCRKSLSSKCHAKYPAVRYDGKVISKYAVLWECKQCKALYADNQQLYDLRRWNENTTFQTISVGDFVSAKSLMQAASCHIAGELLTEKDMPYRCWDDKSENLSSGSKLIQVYASKCHCQKCRNRYNTDTMVNRTAVVETIRGGTVKINVMYCRGCGQYFVSLAVLEQYKNIYGGLLMECKTSSDIDADRLNWFHFAPDTILSRCGYTVKSGVTEQYRQRVLAFILDSGKASKHEIIEKINSFIKIRESQPRFYDACQRWQEDIQFVSNYRLNQQKFVSGLKFQAGRK